MANQMMTLAAAQRELERLGYSVTPLSDLEEEASGIVAVLSQWRWILMNRVYVTVFVTELPVLTMGKLSMDLEALPDRLEAHTVGGCPPPGCNTLSMAVLVYLTKSTVEQEALTTILTTPKKEWGHVTFLAAQDGKGTSHYMDGWAPLWFGEFYPELRHLAGQLTGRPLPENLTQDVCFLIFFIIGLAILILDMFIDDPRFLQAGAIVFILFFVFLTVKVSIRCQRYARRRGLRQPILPHHA
jgi:hypothetical protein